MSTAEALEMQVSVIEFLCFGKLLYLSPRAVSCPSSLNSSTLLCTITPPKPGVFGGAGLPLREEMHFHCLLFTGQSGNVIASRRNSLGIWESS